MVGSYARRCGGRIKRMNKQVADLRELLEQSAADDSVAVGELFDLHRDRLRRMIHLRLDLRLQGRLDPSDVLQEAFLGFIQALPTDAQNPQAPFCLWLRCITARKLHTLHRHHLGARMRNAGPEVSLYWEA